MISVILSVIFLGLVIKWFLSGENGDIEKIPGPSESLWWKLSRKGTEAEKVHLTFYQMFKKYGPIFREKNLAGKSTVLVADYDSIYKVRQACAKRTYLNATVFGVNPFFDNTNRFITQRCKAIHMSIWQF